MYFWIRNSEDGLYVEPLNHDTLIEYIEETTGTHIRPEYRTQFVSEIPDESTPCEHVCIIKGEVVVPEPVTAVTEWKVD